MISELKDTNAAEINATLLKARRNLGVSSGLVFTLVVDCPTQGHEKAIAASLVAGREHPSRILVVVRGRGQTPRLDAEIRAGEDVPGDIIILRVHDALVDHADSIVRSLLLPDLPVVAWWPFTSPEQPGSDPIGVLATRRITDAAGDQHPLDALMVRARNHKPGDTDLTWTRLTPWRALLAAALDQYPAKVTAATVEAEAGNAPAELLASWLQARLKVPVEVTEARGPGIVAVRLTTADGDISLQRRDGRLATYLVPGQPQRLVSLRRRDLNELLTEELRRMDDDDIFDEAMRTFVKRGGK